MYTEAISFSELLKRAKKRNESFKARLFPAAVQREREENEGNDN